MNRYALLVRPSANRVYDSDAPRLAAAELALFGDAVLGGRIGDIESVELGGVPYLTFDCNRLDERDLAVLSHLSAVFAIYELEDGRLTPRAMTSPDRLPDDVITIPKYRGKTNEQFTRLLFNVTLLSSAFAPELLERRFRVLDPLCGRGTTLNQAIVLGHDASGIDLDERDVDAYAAFIRRWMKDHRIKHRAEYAPVRRNHRTVGKRLQVSFAATKEAFRAGDLQQLDVVAADTVDALEFHRPGSFDVIVTDAPYGVQHGSRTVTKGLRRDPLDLLREAMPVWAQLLRAGGALGMAWNTKVAGRDEAADVIAAAGLEVLDDDAHRAFAHRVDASIQRDVLLARRR